MARWRVVERDFPAFLELLRRAESTGTAIEKHQPDRWQSYISEHGFNEDMAASIARQRMESVTAVIIAEGNESDGLYLYSTAEEICLRVVSF